MQLIAAALFVLLGTKIQRTGADDDDAALGSRPNILLMLADDLGWDDVCANQALNGRQRCNIYTPALDALAANGARLMRHYTEPWCLPSRSALLTGIAPAKLGVNFVNMEAHETRLLFGRGPSLSQQEDIVEGSEGGGATGAGAQYVGLATHLKAAGYTTAWVGKWHSVGLPHSMGFQHRFGSLFGQLKDYSKPSLVRCPTFKGPGSSNSNGTREVVQGYATQREAEEAVSIIQSQDWSTGHPFFLYLAWHAPHSPHQRTEEAKRYERQFSRERSYRMGQITALDRGVGAVMRALKKKDLIQSTLVVFISDNGAPGPSHKKASSSASSLRPQPSVQYKQRRRLTNGDATDSAFVAASATRATGKENDHGKRPYPSNYPLHGYKGSLYEGGIRTFAVVSWPKHISTNSFRRAPMHISDWLPTFLHLALPSTVASKATNHLDGKPVWQILIGACDRAPNPSSTSHDGGAKSNFISPQFLNLTQSRVRSVTSSSSSSGGGKRVNDLGCRGAPISISSHLPIFGNGRHKLDQARKQDWARMSPHTGTATETNAALNVYSSAERKNARGSYGPQLPPMYYFARGAHFSLDGTCKVFLDPDSSSDSHGANVYTGRPAPSHCITGSNQQVEAIVFKRVSLVEPLLLGQTEATAAQAQQKPDLFSPKISSSSSSLSTFAVALEVRWSPHGDGSDAKIRHCPWNDMQREWQELTHVQEPDYGGRLMHTPNWNSTSTNKPACFLPRTNL